MRRLSHEEGKFSAASAAFWTGGAFVHVPKDVRVEQPIQIVYLIDEPGTAQYAHTLAVVGEHAECLIREYCLGTPIEGQALHAGALRAVRAPGVEGEGRALPGLGPGRGVRHLHQAGRDRAATPT